MRGRYGRRRMRFLELRAPRALLGIAAVLALIAVGATAPTVEAHVNRTVGPYAILVVLVEEPVYADNHAGFQFWVRKDSVPIAGLEKTVHARASANGVDVDLAIPPMDGTGFYVLDHTTDGAAFDPHGGGAWTLELTGSIDGTQLDTTFPVTFPSYPRIGGAGGTAAAPVAASVSSGIPIVVMLGGVLLAGAAIAVLAISRARGRSPGRQART
jgi:hypothetical protein